MTSIHPNNLLTLLKSKTKPHRTTKPSIKFEAKPSTSFSKQIISHLKRAANQVSPIAIPSRAKPSVIKGSSNDDLLHGTKHNDTIKAGKGNDHIFSAAGNNRLFGGKGNDTFYITLGNNTIHGGKGKDHVILRGISDNFSIVKKGNKQIVTNKQTGEINTLFNIEKISFNEFKAETSIDQSSEIVEATTKQEKFTHLIGDPRPENTEPLATNLDWIIQISALFYNTTLPTLADTSISFMIQETSADDLKKAITNQLEESDFELGHNIFQALGNPIYPRNRSTIPEVHLANLINYIKNDIPAEVLKAAILSNLPEDSNNTNPFQSLEIQPK